MQHPIIQKLEKAQMKENIPAFSPGDTVCVSVRVREGTRERLQDFVGVVIAIRRRGFNSSVTVRKMSGGEGIERVFPLHSPLVEKITIERYGKMRQAKPYYLRDLKGRAARIVEDLRKKAKKTEGK